LEELQTQTRSLDNVPPEYVACITCFCLVTFKQKDGTKGMLTHKCIENSTGNLKQSKLTSFTEHRCLPSSVRNELKTELVKFVAQDLQPFSVVSGNRFASFYQSLVNVGAKYGQVDISNELHDRTTLAHRVPSLVEKSKSKVHAKISSCEHVAMT